MKKIVDAFMFYNELDMLTYRLEIHGPHVDHFVIVECPVSFAGKPKPMYFLENKERYSKWLHKITHVIWDGYRSPALTLDDAWFNENTQRNYIQKGLDQLGLGSDDVIFITDLDEIVDPAIFENIDALLGINPIVRLSMDLYYYDIEHKVATLWQFPRAARYEFLQMGVTPHKCRNTSRVDPVVENAGWHMSFFGNERFIINKVKNYAHMEAATLFSDDDTEKVRRVIETCSDFAGRKGTEYEPVFLPKSENLRLPPRLDILPHQRI